MKKFLLFAAAVAFASGADIAKCLQSAYPDTVKAISPDVIEVRGVRVAIDSSGQSDFERLLDSAGVADQMSQAYPAGFEKPSRDFDPGRIRSSAFFDAMYGATKSATTANLVRVRWTPSGKSVDFSTVNGAAAALQAVADEIAADAKLSAFARDLSGTYVYRDIAGSQRKSAHGYGIAIDVHFPEGKFAYWQWSGCKPRGACAYPAGILDDPRIQAVVQIFERHGFIWGGKWYHFDSMHFEYRPELLSRECR